MKTLDDLRREIDRIDGAIAALFSERMDAARAVAEIKAVSHVPVCNPARENEVLASVSRRFPTELRPAVRALFTALMRLSREYQYTLLAAGGARPTFMSPALAEEKAPAHVCYQGIEGSWSSLACAAMFPGVKADPVSSFEDVFSQLALGRADRGVLPIENSTAGVIAQVYDGLAEHGLYITLSYEKKITNCLAAPRGGQLSDIKRVYSHPQALSQCSALLRRLGCVCEPCSNTAVAARMAADAGDTGTAALCSPEAAARYGLDILVGQADDSPYNRTRFVAVSASPQPVSGPSRASLTFTLPHESGSLGFVLSVFSDFGQNLSCIHSRPLPGSPWEYRFYLDFCGDAEDPAVASALLMLESELPSLKFLGFYRELPPEQTDKGK